MGKLPIPLDDHGIEEADRLKSVLENIPLHAIFHSPQLRTTQTAEKIAEAHGHLRLSPHPSLSEVNYGDWEGKPFETLRDHEAFVAYFSAPETCAIPGGERLCEVQARMIAFMESLRSRTGETLLLVSHSDVIKAALVHYLALPLNAIHQLRIDNGSVSALQLGPRLNRVIAVNYTPSLSCLLAL